MNRLVVVLGIVAAVVVVALVVFGILAYHTLGHVGGG